MHLGTVAAFTWPDAAALLGLLLTAMFLIGASMAFYLELRKTKLRAAQEEQLRQLVRRYEQLAETTLDAQQRVAADVSELRSRTTSIEKILRTVDGE
jgi:Tfp pilus assembly protein PilO